MLSSKRKAGVFWRRNLLKKEVREIVIETQDKELIQWHPAFYASLQIELKEEAGELIFENEHQLGTKPKAIDVLIIRKKKKRRIEKNIARIFRKHNIIEYKGPEESLGIDDFYKVYAYAFFYKSDTQKSDSIAIEELTVTFVCKRYPRKLIRHLREKRNCDIAEIESGIYYVRGDILPIQILVISRLSEAENLWLHNLASDLTESQVRCLITEYQKNSDDNRYRSVMEAIVQANREKFVEVKSMACKALLEIMEPEINEIKKQIRKETRETAWAEGLNAGHSKGLQEGRKAGLQEGLKIVIETYREMSLPREMAKNQIIEKFLLPVEEAENYMERYW